MNLTVHAVTINAVDPPSAAAFWAAALGGQIKETGNGYILVETDTEGLPRLLFAPVDQHVHVPGRIHLDLAAADTVSEIARLESLGATVVEQCHDSNFTWTVLTDPEGNPFCIG